MIPGAGAATARGAALPERVPTVGRAAALFIQCMRGHAFHPFQAGYSPATSTVRRTSKMSSSRFGILCTPTSKPRIVGLTFWGGFSNAEASSSRTSSISSTSKLTAPFSVRTTHAVSRGGRLARRQLQNLPHIELGYDLAAQVDEAGDRRGRQGHRGDGLFPQYLLNVRNADADVVFA